MKPDLPGTGDAVQPWCSSRPADTSVICTCRCENEDGRTDDDGGPYCSCPTGYTCTLLLTGGFSESGGYCIKTGTAFDADGGCAACNPISNPCP